MLKLNELKLKTYIEDCYLDNCKGYNMPSDINFTEMCKNIYIIFNYEVNRHRLKMGHNERDNFSYWLEGGSFFSLYYYDDFKELYQELFGGNAPQNYTNEYIHQLITDIIYNLIKWENDRMHYYE